MSKFYGARAVSTVSGKGAIVQYSEHFYQLDFKENKYSWTILPQKLNMTFPVQDGLPKCLKTGTNFAVMMTLPEDYTC